MKKHGNTLVPRRQELNEALVALGQKTHKDGRTKALERDKQDKRRQEQLEDMMYE